MSEVRVHLDLAGVRLRFEGEQPFFERWVEPLMQATYRRAAQQPQVDASPEREEAETPVPAETAGADVATPRAEPTAATATEVSVPEPAGDTFQPASPLHFNQFVAQVGGRASTPEQRVMAFGFYLWNYEKRETFTTRDVEGFFRTVRDEPPSFLADLLDDLVIRKRFVEEDADDDTWRLTTKGVNYVKNRLLGGD